MAAPKYKTSDLKKIYPEGKDQNLHDKRFIEALIQRLNEKIARDENSCKKAALILESWIHSKKK